MTRPEKPVDWKLVDNLLMANCHGTEIAAHFNMHPDTFYNKVKEHFKMGFTEYSLEKKSKGDSLLKAKQFDKALKGDNSMLIWLGKQRLNQKENNDNRIPENIIEKFDSFMNQISDLQSDRKIANNNISEDAKS